MFGISKKIIRNQNSGGFTIIEVLIVMAIAALILLIVFLVVPTAHRNVRNNMRLHDAALVAAAISNCVTERGSPNFCMTPQSLDINPSQLEIYSEYSYWDINTIYTCPPVICTDGPVWAFHTKCGSNGPVDSGVATSFSVNYKIEKGQGVWGAWCQNG